MSKFWDDRYGGDAYVYGTEPNDFVREVYARIPAGGRVVCLAEGEGRNAVFLAERGYRVTAVDQSSVGLRKAARLAASRGVALETVQADLAAYALGEARWEGIVAVFAHVPPAVRRALHAQVPAALAPGGCIVIEAYRPAQLEHGTGGPPEVALLPSLAELRAELAPLPLVIGREVTREIHEGEVHHGTSATVQVVAARPPETRAAGA